MGEFVRIIIRGFGPRVGSNEGISVGIMVGSLVFSLGIVVECSVDPFVGSTVGIIDG